MVSGVKETLGKRKMKSHLFLKVGVDSHALTSIETLSFYINEEHYVLLPTKQERV